MFPPDYPGLVNGQDADEIADVMLKVLAALKSGELVRRHFLARFTLEQHLAALVSRRVAQCGNDRRARSDEGLTVTEALTSLPNSISDGRSA